MAQLTETSRHRGASARAERQRVLLHVNVAGGGTTSLRATLSRDRGRLATAGVRYPAADRLFFAAVDLRNLHRAWGLHPTDVAGRGDLLLREARAHRGVTVIGHDLLDGASPRQVARARSMLVGLDVHVVATAPVTRDAATDQALGRVLQHWGGGLSDDRVHTLTGGTGDVLLARLLAVAGVGTPISH